MVDETEDIRRQMLVEINGDPNSRESLEKKYGKVYSTDELRHEFEVVGFGAPLVVVKRLSDGALGSMYFQHDPRLYYNFEAD